MNIFSAPNWDIDEASAALSSSAFGGSVSCISVVSCVIECVCLYLASSNTTFILSRFRPKLRNRKAPPSSQFQLQVLILQLLML